MVGGTKLPPQDSESGPWLNEHKAKARATPRATPKPKPSSKGKRKTFRLVHVSLDNADTVIEGGPAKRIQNCSRGCPVQALLGRGFSSCANEISPFEPGKDLDGSPCLLLSDPQFVKALEIQPKFRTRAKKMSEAQGIDLCSP